MGLCNILMEMERGRGRWVTGSRDTAAPTHRRQAQSRRATLSTYCEEISTGVKGWGLQVLALRLEDQNTVRAERSATALTPTRPTVRPAK